MKKIILSILITSLIYSCQQPAKTSDLLRTGTANEQKEVISMLDSFNRAAANADYNTYFNFFTDDAIFCGTDATERWNKNDFMLWAKPYFDKKTTWNFTSVERHIYFNNSDGFAWFDELLNTQMKICRGSGVLVKQNDGWKIKQYILSATIPNKVMDSVVKIKAPLEDVIIKRLTQK